jgi:chromosome condensin MukBEF MukE localization factor
MCVNTHSFFHVYITAKNNVKIVNEGGMVVAKVYCLFCASPNRRCHQGIEAHIPLLEPPVVRDSRQYIQSIYVIG